MRVTFWALSQIGLTKVTLLSIKWRRCYVSQRLSGRRCHVLWTLIQCGTLNQLARLVQSASVYARLKRFSLFSSQQQCIPSGGFCVPPRALASRAPQVAVDGHQSHAGTSQGEIIFSNVPHNFWDVHGHHIVLISISLQSTDQGSPPNPPHV